MRPVRLLGGAKPPAAWLAKADKLTQKLMNAPDDASREAIITAGQTLWQDKKLVDWLLSTHHDKCWYTEAKESVSSYHVDHFRPKGRVTESNGVHRTGYWWLAFDWRNYRISGQLINVKKKDVFPVRFPGHANPADPGSLTMEGCHLIDPLEHGDAWLISFERKDDSDCLAEPSPGVDGDDMARVIVTIDVLGLNRLDRLNKNRAGIWDDCVSYIKQYDTASKNPIHIVRRALQEVAVNEIAKLIDETAEFSSVAVACLQKLAPQVLRTKVEDQINRARQAGFP